MISIMDLKALELTFENLDSVVIPRKNICSFKIYDVTTTYELYQHHDVVCKTDVAHYVYLVLHPDADHLDTQYAIDYDTPESSGGLFDRLKYNDICVITMIGRQGEKHDIYPIWVDEKDADDTNACQKTKIAEHTGNCVIKIKKPKDEPS